MISILEKKHAILVTEFDRYVVEHPEFAVNIPRNSQIVLQLEEDNEYNEWSKQLAAEWGTLLHYAEWGTLLHYEVMSRPSETCPPSLSLRRGGRVRCASVKYAPEKQKAKKGFTG